MPFYFLLFFFILFYSFRIAKIRIFLGMAKNIFKGEGKGDQLALDCRCNVITARLNAGGYQFQSNHNALIGLTPPADTVARWSSINEAKGESEALAPAYPNPATEEVNIPCRYEQGGSNLLQIYDAAGRLVSPQQVMPYTVKVTVRVAGYAKGLCTYRLNGTARKFIVQ
ncbi:MAG: T9SS type A sorting domain-containing protein [Bacteroidales bacterium]|nr:T9SS type A sorting domain-containing protein [Bacteroidales bacterium]